MKDGELFFSERVWPCHAGGYWWELEAVDLVFTFVGPRVAYNESAIGTAAFRWSARRKINRHKQQFQAALDHIQTGGEG